MTAVQCTVERAFCPSVSHEPLCQLQNAFPFFSFVSRDGRCLLLDLTEGSVHSPA